MRIDSTQTTVESIVSCDCRVYGVVVPADLASRGKGLDRPASGALSHTSRGQTGRRIIEKFADEL